MMLGPMKKKMITVGIVACLIPCILFGVFFWMYSTSNKNKIKELETQVAELYLVGFSGDFPIEHVVKKGDLTYIPVKGPDTPINSYLKQNSEDAFDKVVGKKLKIPVMSSTIAVETMFYEENDYVERDIRSKEYNTILLPSDLKKGDVIDVRIKYPTGNDYIVAIAKEIKSIGSNADSNTVFLDLTEEEIQKIGAALVESYITDAVDVYAVKYVNPQQQLKNEYPMNYVKKYKDAINELLKQAQEQEEALAETMREPVLDESGEQMVDEEGQPVYRKPAVKRITEADITIEDIASYADLSVGKVEEIRKALEENDEYTIKKLENSILTVPDELEETYPVPKEVALLMANNPNLDETIQKKYNDSIATLEKDRDDLINNYMYEHGVRPDGTVGFRIDPETGWLVEDDELLENVAKGFNEEIKAQKAERKAYLQSLIQNQILADFK